MESFLLMLKCPCSIRLKTVATFFVGWCFYIFVRRTDPIRAFNQDLLDLLPSLALPKLVVDTSPSFIFSIGTVLLLSDAFKNWWHVVHRWILLTLGFETLQTLIPALGTFDWLDLGAIIAGGLLGAVIEVCHNHRPVHEMNIWNESIFKPLSIAFITVSSVATSAPRGGVISSHEPICMTKEDFRNSFAVESPKGLRTSGRIYSHGNYLFVSEAFEGIHVFDNTDRSNPVAKSFLKILGNTDLVANGAYLYADSATDLLTLKIAGDSIMLVSRQEGVLYLRATSILGQGRMTVRDHEIKDCEASGGVVVGYRTRAFGKGFEKSIEENRND